MHTNFYFVKLSQTDKHFKPYAKDLQQFLTYLTYTKKTKFQLNLFTPELKHEKIILDYYNRYSERYFKSLYARLIKFNELYVSDKVSKNQLIYVYLITLTVPQKYKSIYQCLDDLRTSRKVIFQYLRDIRKKRHSIEWLWFTEPHKSGYPHTHIMILSDFNDFSNYEKKLKSLWHTTAGANYVHGLDFEYIGVVGAVADGASVDGEGGACISNIVQYIIKYMSKSLMSSVDLPTLIFHSQVAKFYNPNPRYPGTGSGAYRLWGYSAGLSPYLKKQKKEPIEGLNVLSFGYAGQDSKVFYHTYNDELFFSILRRYSDDYLIKNKVIED